MRGGDDDKIPVVEVGTGVGYFSYATSRREGENSVCLFDGLGRPGEEKGSKAGSSDGAGRLTPAAAGNVGDRSLLLGNKSIVPEVKLLKQAFE